MKCMRQQLPQVRHDAGPRTGDLYACNQHAEEIGREPGAWPWLTPQKEAAR